MLKTNVQIDGVGEFKARYARSAIEKAMRRTLNDLTSRAGTAVKRKIREIYNIRARDLVKRGTHNRQGMEVRLSRGASGDAYIIGFGGPLPLIHFATTPKTPDADLRRKRRNGVRVKVKHAGGTKRLKRVFVARMQSGHIGLFERTGRERTPIQQKYGPGVGSMLGGRESMDEIRKTINSNAQTVFDRNVRFYTQMARK